GDPGGSGGGGLVVVIARGNITLGSTGRIYARSTQPGGKGGDGREVRYWDEDNDIEVPVQTHGGGGGGGAGGGVVFAKCGGVWDNNGIISVNGSAGGTGGVAVSPG